MTAIRAAVLDMDGLLIDTEPIWRQVEIEVFGALGLHLSEEQCLETMGVRVPDVVALWYSRHLWEGATIPEVTERIIHGVIDHVLQNGVPKAGVCETLHLLHGAGLPMAIASSSSVVTIEAVVERLDIAPWIKTICSADDEVAGKPHPAVFLRAASRLGVPPEACVAFEDSPNGVLSAKAAGMYCILVPDPHLANDPRMSQADMRLESLEEFTPALLTMLQAL